MRAPCGLYNCLTDWLIDWWLIIDGLFTSHGQAWDGRRRILPHFYCFALRGIQSRYVCCFLLACSLLQLRLLTRELDIIERGVRMKVGCYSWFVFLFWLHFAGRLRHWALHSGALLLFAEAKVLMLLQILWTLCESLVTLCLVSSIYYNHSSVLSV